MQTMKMSICGFKIRTILPNFCSRISLSTDAQIEYNNHNNAPGYMKGWIINDFNGIDGLQLSNEIRIPPILHPNEVLVRVSSASVNPLDILATDGYGNEVFDILRTWSNINLCSSSISRNEKQITGGRDFSGEVVRVGHSVKDVKPKDKVWGVVAAHLQGSHAEYVITYDTNLCLMPHGLSHIEAASLPYVALTGWSAAVVSGGLRPNNCYGSQILVIGASGGVGIFLTQILSSWGAEVVGVCSEEAYELVLSCGASQVYDYRNLESINELIKKPRFNLIIDAGGNPDIRWAEALQRWKNASYVSLSSPLLRNTDKFGFIPGAFKSFNEILQHNMSTLPEGRLIKWGFFMPNYKALKRITKMVEEKKIRPVIDKIFSFEETRKAYRHVLDGPSRGKTVIDLTTKIQNQ